MRWWRDFWRTIGRCSDALPDAHDVQGRGYGPDGRKLEPGARVVGPAGPIPTSLVSIFGLSGKARTEEPLGVSDRENKRVLFMLLKGNHIRKPLNCCLCGWPVIFGRCRATSKTILGAHQFLE
jgi:hypothetical protein